ncbi:MAG: LytR/AlgR family response regulator transcription factor [Bacteroidales bacterium]
MKILIIEDELPAKVQLERLITRHFSNFEIVGHQTSVKGAIEWLQSHTADLIFTDVELSDGRCFEIFKSVTPEADIIFTTAYDNYAIQAFKVNGLDYLLKPIDEDEFVAAVKKSIKKHQREGIDLSTIQELILSQNKREFRKRFSIRLGDKIYIIQSDDIAYFYSEDKVTFLVTNDAKRHISDYSLDQIETMVDPDCFFRISRGCVTHINAIKSVSKHFNSRLKVILHPDMCKDVLVSRIRVPEFMKWIGDSF